MKLVNLTLINIGPYVGVNTFELNSDKEINTSLIGGRNGTGKTTFLESIRLGLYGPLALGFKTTSATYLKEIDSLLNNDEKEKHLPEFQISIDVMLTENWQEKQYSIKRSWNILNNNLTEKVEITSGAKILSPIDKDNFFNKLFNRFPPDLFDLCLFDGEKIKSLDDSNLANYLKELSLNLFNLDLFNELKRELGRYVRQTADTERETKLITEIDDINNEIESISKEIN